MDRVYENLRVAILNGDLAPGERLVEMRIAEELGSSRGPIREAMERLAQEGLVESRPRRGTYVSMLRKRDAWEIYTLRAALEGLAFCLAPSHMTAKTREQLQAVVDNMRILSAEGDIVGLSELDTQFHETIVRMVEHDRLLTVWTSIIGQIHLLSTQVIKTHFSDLSAVPDRHQALLDVLSSGSTAQRVAEIEQHIQSAADRVLSHFDEEV